MKHYKQLTYTDRLIIEKMHGKHTQVKIARTLGVSESTISREIKRGLYKRLSSELVEYPAYSADIAQEKHDFAQTSKGNEIKLTWQMVELCTEYLVKQKMSVRAFCGRMKYLKKDMVSAVTLYRYISLGYIPNLTAKEIVRKKKYHHVSKTAKRAPVGTSIEKRPQKVNTRADFGHWEIDSVVGRACGRSQSLLVLTERKTRFEIILKAKNKTASETVRLLKYARRKYGNVFRSVTCDNGCEFADYNGMKKITHEVYYCHPYSSYERGSNENCNRIIRRYFPKGMDFSKLTQRQVNIVNDVINDIPRGILGYRTAREVYEEELKNFFQ